MITTNLWQNARALANQHLNNPQYYVDDEVQWDFNEDVLVFSEFHDVSEDNENYTTFGKNIREFLGLGIYQGRPRILDVLKPPSCLADYQ